MPFPNVYEPSQLAILRNALDEHCAAKGITHDIERERVAIRLMGLFAAGAETVAELRSGLEQVSGSDRVT